MLFNLRNWKVLAWDSPGQTLKWVTFPLSREIFPTQGWNSGLPLCRHIFISWATREAPEYWSGQPIPSSADLPDQGIELGSPALQAGSLPTELSGKLIRKLSGKEWRVIKHKPTLCTWCFVKVLVLGISGKDLLLVGSHSSSLLRMTWGPTLDWFCCFSFLVNWLGWAFLGKRGSTVTLQRAYLRLGDLNGKIQLSDSKTTAHF